MRSFLFYLLFFYVLISVCASPLHAQSPFWKSTNGPLDTLFLPPDVNDIGVDDTGRIFVALPNGIFVLAPGAAAWIKSTGDSSTQRLSEVCFAFAHQGIAYATNDSGVLNISSDGGATWHAGPSGVGDSGDVTGIVPNLLLTRDSLLFSATYDGLFVSSDQGAHWRTLLGRSRNATGATTVISFYASAAGTYLAGTIKNPAVLRSTNKGATWDTIPTLPIITNFAGSGKFIYATQYQGGYFRSTDDGVTWQQIAPELDAKNVFAMQCYDSVRVLVEINKTPQIGDRVFRTTDGWVNWNVSMKGIIGDSLSGVTMTNAGGNSFGTVVLATDSGIYVSRDSGKNWQLVNPQLLKAEALNAGITTLCATAHDTVFAASPTRGLFRTANLGATWNVCNGDLPTEKIFAITRTIYGTLYVATDSGVYRSTNSGAHWMRATTGIFPADVAAFASNDIGDVYAATDSGLFRTINTGASWEKLNSGLPVDSMLSVAVFNTDTLLVGTYNGVYVSTDRGDHWAAASNGIVQEWVHAIAFGKFGEIYVGVENDGIFRSLDGGASWNNFSDSINFTTVHSLVVDQRGVAFAATDSGMYRLPIGATAWERLPFDSSTTIGSHTVIATASNFIFAEGAGEVYRGEGPANAVQQAVAAPREMSLALFPNPSQSEIDCNYFLSAPGAVKITVLNTPGQVLAVPVDGRQSTGPHTVTLNTQLLSPGIYLLALQIGSAAPTIKFFQIEK